jgi:c-di-GMP-binding flagellar brake protein YcgR
MAATATSKRQIQQTAETSADSATPSIQTAYLSENAEITRAFKLLRDQRAPIQLNFKNQPTTYIGKVLDLAGEDFLLEDLQPRDGLRKMRPGAEFSLSSRIQGVYVHSASNRVIAVEAERGVPFFRIRLPRTLLYQQRRRSARFTLLARVAAAGASISMVRSKVSHKDEPVNLVGRLIDISAGGCWVEFDTPAALKMDRNEPVTCSIDIPNMLSFTAQGAIRHSTHNTRRRVMNCGVELLEMAVTDRRRLEHFIESIRRSMPASSTKQPAHSL